MPLSPSIVKMIAAMPPRRGRQVIALLPMLMGARAVVDTRWQKHRAARQPVIDATRAKIVKQLRFARAEVERNLEDLGHLRDEPVKSAGAAADLVFSLQNFRKGLSMALRQAGKEAVGTAGRQALDELGYDDVYTMAPAKLAGFLEARENKLSGVADEIHGSIMDVLRAGFERGDSEAKIAAAIAEKFDEIEEGRAETIASTEAAAAYGVARQDAQKQAGVGFKRWLTSGLPTVRQAHADAAEDPRNEAVPLDEPFMVGGEELMYPGDEEGSPENVINCHCVSIPVSGPDDAGDETEGEGADDE